MKERENNGENLLAEDEEVLRMLVVDTLEDEGHDIDEACDGEEALEMIKQNDYDLIYLII